jgi:hypothetical protein
MTEGMWSPLSDTDPVPGDPWKVNELGYHFLDQAEKIREMVNSLKNKVQPDDVKSVVVNAMIEKRDEVIPDLKLLAERYDSSGEALRTYSKLLDDAQEKAQQARTDSWAAHRRLTDAQRAQAAANPTMLTPGGTVAVAPPVPAGPVIGPPQPDYEEEIRLAKADLDKADRLLEEATDLRDLAAGRARKALDEANHDDLKNPNRSFFSPLTSTWDSIKNLPKNVVTLAGAALAVPLEIATNPTGVGKGLWKWTLDSFSSWKTFGDHLGVIGAALGVAGMIFPPFGAAVGTVALAISVTKFGIDTYMAATGQGSWGDVAMGAIGLATMGAGRIAAQAQRTAVLRDATRDLRVLKGMSSLDEAEKLRKMQKLQKVMSIHKGDAVAKGFLPKMQSWGGAILRDPDAPVNVVMKYSPSAQKIAKLSDALAKYDKVDGVLGKIGTANTFAELTEPVVEKHLQVKAP